MTKRLIACFFIGLLFSFGAIARDFYWENPEQVSGADSRFPSSSTNGNASIVIWQEVKENGNDSGTIWLSARVFDGKEWYLRERFAGPIVYAGDVPSVASVTIDAKNRILVSAASAVDTISVWSSTDWGATFTAAKIRGQTDKLLAPRVFVRSDGGYLLFATRGSEDNFNLDYSRSDMHRMGAPSAFWSRVRPKTCVPARARDGRAKRCHRFSGVSRRQ